MQSSTICPECGSGMVDGACPACVASETHSRGDSSSLKWDYVFAVIAVLFLALLGFGLSKIGDEVRERRHYAQVMAARRGSAVARRDQLTGSGRIYLVQIGAHNAPYSLNDFAEWLRSKYGLEVEILPPVALDSAAWDSVRKQYAAELLTDQLKREHPSLAEDSQAYLIGFTDADMYPVHNTWNSTFTWRDGRAAVVSTDGMQDRIWQRIGEDRSVANRHFQARLRRILLKDVGILYWHLALNYDPASLLQQRLDPDIPLKDIYESDLAPERTRSGRAEGEPCIFFSYSSQDGMKSLPGNLVRSCTDVGVDETRDESMELFEVDLQLGLLMDKHTDFYLPDSVPIQFQRNTRDGWKGPMGFGISGTHNYDNYLGSWDGMRTVGIYQADGGSFNMKRVPSWLAMLSLVKFVDADYSGRMAELRWHTDRFEHFELKRFNGEVETYLPCGGGSPPCYQVGFRNAKGEALIFERDPQRKLTRLESPNRNELRLTYDNGGRIAEISDSRGRTVRYTYDAGGRLVRVHYPSGEVFYYEYDGTQHLLTFSAAPDATSKPVVVLRNEYENGRISRQSFGDQTYTYSYESGDGDTIRAATVRTPQGMVFEVAMKDGESAVRQRPAP